jgi:Mg-chelatase subunit ChlD
VLAGRGAHRDRVAVVGAAPQVARALLAMTATTELVEEEARS